MDTAFNRVARIASAIAVSLVCSATMAQSPPPPTASGRARVAQPAPAGTPLPGAGVDLASLAKGYADSVQQAPVAPSGPVLMVFVSFSMPQQSLDQLVRQAEATGAVLVLRGLEGGSMMATAKRIKELIGQRRVQFQIDPLSFDRYGIRAVPTFVLASDAGGSSPCSGAQCYSSAQFTSVAGDVSIAYALEQFERRAPRFRAAALAMRKKAGG